MSTTKIASNSLPISYYRHRKVRGKRADTREQRPQGHSLAVLCLRLPQPVPVLQNARRRGRRADVAAKVEEGAHLTEKQFRGRQYRLSAPRQLRNGVLPHPYRVLKLCRQVESGRGRHRRLQGRNKRLYQGVQTADRPQQIHRKNRNADETAIKNQSALKKHAVKGTPCAFVFVYVKLRNGIKLFFPASW